ncbi:FAD-dependent monooxygenase [Dermacoccaceae bacterium W4C1]
MTTRRRVAIVGGGLAGSALAAALDPQRFEVVVYEAEPGRSGAGSAVGLWPSARRALRRLGVHGLPERNAHSGAGLFRLDGRRLVASPGSGPLMVLRPELLAALHQAVPASVTWVTENVGDPTALDADLVIGADGVRSVVRPLVRTEAGERIASDFIALRGLQDRSPDPAVVGEYWGRGRMFGIVPVGADRTYWFTAHRSDLGPEPLDASEVLAQARAEFRDAAPVVSATLAEAGPQTLATRLWSTPAMPRYRNGRYLMIGDAAHAAMPNLGRGACDAIVDGESLGRALNSGAPHAITAWEARRLPFTQATRMGASGVLSLATAPWWS